MVAAKAEMGAWCEVADLHDKEDLIGMGVAIGMERPSVSGGGRLARTWAITSI
jgi:hypothetical protein